MGEEVVHEEYGCVEVVAAREVIVQKWGSHPGSIEHEELWNRCDSVSHGLTWVQCSLLAPSRGKNKKKKTLAFERYRPTDRLGDERVVASVRSATIWSQIQLWLIKFESIAIGGNARIRWYWVSRSPDCGWLVVSWKFQSVIERRSANIDHHRGGCTVLAAAAGFELPAKWN